MSASVLQEVMLEAGSGAVKGKESADTFDLYEVTGSGRKLAVLLLELCICLFSLSVSQKTFRGKENAEEVGLSFEEMCAKHL